MKAKTLSVILTFVHIPLVYGLGPEVLHENGTTNSSRRILNGDIANPTDFPFLVQVSSSDLTCGGSIISNYFVLTAAHCLAEHDCLTINILPSTWTPGQEIKIKVVQCFIHEQYVHGKKYYFDIALMRTLDDLLYDGTLRTIPLSAPGTHYSTGTPAVITGWGKVDTNYPGHLLRADILVEDWDTCNYKYKHSEPDCISDAECPVPDIPQGEICTQSQGPTPQGICHGDSGGPLIINGVLAGVIVGLIMHNWECVLGTPSLYTNVADFLPWINSIVESNRNKRQISVTAESS